MTENFVGSTQIIFRYPVKSMQGETIESSYIDEKGVLGDRAYALIDQETEFVVSAKHPRKWPHLLQGRARYDAPLSMDELLPYVRIVLPDGNVVHSDDPNCDEVLSTWLGRSVQLRQNVPESPRREANRAKVDDLYTAEVIREEPIALASPKGTFFDHAPLHLLTTSTLRQLRAYHHDFDFRRFRPNLVVETSEDHIGFIENEWLGKRLKVGAEVVIEIIDPSPRCVVITQAQDDLPRSLDILKTVAQYTSATSVTAAPGVKMQGVVGVYARVVQGGTMQLGDPIHILAAE